MYKIVSKDFSAFVYGRKILKTNSQASIEFVFGGTENFSEQFWNNALIDISKNKTRFGRVGIVYDRKNKSARDFISSFDFESLKYNPQENRAHTEKNIRVTTIETQILVEMANEGLADSVEFRRLARKQLRPLKHANIDTIFFFEDILAEEKTRKILSTIIGGQRRIVFPIDYFLDSEATNGGKRELKINVSNQGFDLEFIIKRAENIMKTKISK